MNNHKYLRQDDQALQQLMETVGEEIKVKRKLLRRYNDKGVAQNVSDEFKIFGNLQYFEKSAPLNDKGQGRWVSTGFNLTCVGDKNFVQVDDIIISDKYGTLRVESISDLTAYGEQTSKLVRTGSTEFIKDNRGE